MEILGLIIIVLIWFFKAAMNNEEKKGRTKALEKEENYTESGGQGGWKLRTYADVLTSSMSVDGAARNINDALDALDTKRAKERESKKHPSGKRPSPVEIKEFHEQRRADEWEKSEQRRAAERASSEKRWAAARKQQADAALVHGVHIDSCEGRLESLRVLYEAGILDREEYAQRVARVRRAHTQQ